MTTKTYTHNVLTKLEGTPTAASIQLLTKEVYSNARSVYSVFGGANHHGHLGIAMPPAAYLLQAQVAFVPPNPVGAQPPHANSDTAAMIGADRWTHCRATATN